MSDSDLALVRARRAAIARSQAQLAEEDHDLEITERTLAKLQASKPKVYYSDSGVEAPVPKPVSAMSQPDYVVGTLKATTNPWVESALALRNMIRQMHGVDIGANSFHPILHHLREDGIIVRDGQRIALAERVKRTN